MFEDGRQRRDFVHVADVARAVRGGARPRRAGHHAYNVGSGTVTTIGEMATALARRADGPPPVVTGEFRLGDVRHITASSDAGGGPARRGRPTVPLAEGVQGLVAR